MPDTPTIDDAKTAEAMFNAYNEQGPNPWKTFDGRDVPRWDQVSDQVRAKWIAAAHHARQALHAGTFGWALAQLRAGATVCRSGWNGKGMWLGLQIPDAHSKMSLPYIFMSTVDGKLVPWLASQTDMLATDWQLVA